MVHPWSNHLVPCFCALHVPAWRLVLWGIYNEITIQHKYLEGWIPVSKVFHEAIIENRLTDKFWALIFMKQLQRAHTSWIHLSGYWSVHVAVCFCKVLAVGTLWLISCKMWRLAMVQACQPTQPSLLWAWCAHQKVKPKPAQPPILNLIGEVIRQKHFQLTHCNKTGCGHFRPNH